MMKTLALVGTVMAMGAGCTPEQLDRYEAMTGIQFGTGQRAALLAVDDRPMQLPDGRTIAADGTVIDTEARARACDEYVPTFVAAGWPREVARWASTVMWRETRCNAGAVSPTADYGLMQINRIVLADMRARPWLWKTTIDRLGGVPTGADLLDPTTNAIVALGLYNIRGARPWA